MRETGQKADISVDTSTPGPEAHELTPAYITETDASDLRWYFSDGMQMLTGKSNFGAMLDRMELYGIRTSPCLHCGGQLGETDKDGNTITPEKVGSGFVWDTEEGKIREMLRLLDLPVESLQGDLICPKCRGLGFVWPKRQELSDGEMMKLHETHGAPADTSGGSGSLARLGHVSRLISAVKRRSPRLFQVLEAFYAPDGGSEACLWHLTAAGKTLLRRNSQNLPQRQFFENERDRQRAHSDRETGLLFRAAEDQSKELRRQATALWCEVAG